MLTFIATFSSKPSFEQIATGEPGSTEPVPQVPAPHHGQGPGKQRRLPGLRFKGSGVFL